RQGIGSGLAIVDSPTFGRTPAVAALIVLHHQLFGFAVVGYIRSFIAVEVGNYNGCDSFLRSDRIDAETGIRGQFVELRLHAKAGRRDVGFTGLVVEQGDLGTGVVDDDQIVEPVAVEIGSA